MTLTKTQITDLLKEHHKLDASIAAKKQQRYEIGQRLVTAAEEEARHIRAELTEKWGKEFVGYITPRVRGLEWSR